MKYNDPSLLNKYIIQRKYSGTSRFPALSGYNHSIVVAGPSYGRTSTEPICRAYIFLNQFEDALIFDSIDEANEVIKSIDRKWTDRMYVGPISDMLEAKLITSELVEAYYRR